VTPNEAACAPRPRVDTALIKALARAFRWRRMLDEGVCATIGELAKREKVNRGYMSRVLWLTLLAPDIVEAIIDGTSGAELTLARVLKPFPEEWDMQPNHFSGSARDLDCRQVQGALTDLRQPSTKTLGACTSRRCPTISARSFECDQLDSWQAECFVEEAEKRPLDP
jgi:hypothetical protein